MKQIHHYAKISRPETSGVFHRKRLFELLDQARKKPVVWITAPPGSGKTTLIASYLEHQKLPCIWYQIDEGDGDIASFFHYLGLAAKQAAPRFRKPMPNLTPEYLLGLPTFARNYFREMFGRLNPPSPPFKKGGKGGFVIVLDNYHEAPADSQLHDIIQTGLSEIPNCINVIIISRVQPPAQMTRLQASGQFAMLRWEDLKLTQEESIGIARLRHGKKKLSQETLKGIHEQTQGWAAGLALMLEKASTGKIEELKHPTIDTISDYFASEILYKADKETSSLLLKTSVLNSMDAGMAHQLTGIESAGYILSQLHVSNCFTEKRLHSNPVYQYHPLFREFLRQRASTTLPQEELRGLKQRAASLLSESGSFEEAYALFRDICNWDSAIHVIMQSAPALAAEGRLTVLREWIAAIPIEAVEANPWLLYWRGICNIPFAQDKAREDMEKAYRLFHGMNDQTGIFLSLTGVLDSIVNAAENFFLLDPWIDSLESMVQQGCTFPSPEIEYRVTVSMFASMVWRRLGHPNMKIWKERAFSVLSRCEDKAIRIQLLTFLSIFHLYAGDFTTAKKLVDDLRHLSESKDTAPFLALWAKATEALYECLTASFDSCLKTAAEGIRIANATGIHIWDTHLLEHAAAAALSAGDLTTADSMFKKLKALSEKLRQIDRGYYEYLKVWEAVIRRDIPSYHDYIELRHINETLGFQFGEALLQQVLAQISHERGDEKRASEHLSNLTKLAGEMDSQYIGFMAYMLEAQISFDMGKDDKGLAALKNGMAIGKIQDFKNFQGWRYDVMAMLCVRALEHGIEAEYVQNLIKERNIIPEKPPLHLENWPWPVRIYTLGRFAIVKDGKPIRFTEKAKHTPLKLLKAIIALGGRDIGAEIVIDTLWPDADGDTGLRSLNTTLHRLRKLLGNDMAITLEDNRLNIDVRHVWIDVFAFQRLLGKIENMLKKADLPAGQTGAKDDNLNQLMERVVAMYQGPFLRDISEQWALSFRERLKNRYLYILGEIAQRFEQSQDWQKAIQCCEKCVEIDNISEENYRRLMAVYNKLGRKSEGLAVYKRCKEALNLHLGISPSQETEAIHKSLRS